MSLPGSPHSVHCPLLKSAWGQPPAGGSGGGLSSLSGLIGKLPGLLSGSGPRHTSPLEGGTHPSGLIAHPWKDILLCVGLREVLTWKAGNLTRNHFAFLGVVNDHNMGPFTSLRGRNLGHSLILVLFTETPFHDFQLGQNLLSNNCESLASRGGGAVWREGGALLRRQRIATRNRAPLQINLPFATVTGPFPLCTLSPLPTICLSHMPPS